MNRRPALAALWIVILLALLSAGPARRAAGQAGVQPAALYAPTLLWQRCPSPPGWCETGWYASPAVADINKDGQPDVLWGGYTLMALNGATGAVEWNRPATNDRIWPSIAVADLFGNGQLQVITGQSSGLVTVYDSAGNPLAGWPKSADSNEIRSLAVADLESDHQQEIIVASTNGPNDTGNQHWWVYEPNGSLRPGWPRLQNTGDGYAAGAYNENVGVADLNGDGKAEIIGPSDVHYITAYHNDGSQIAVNPLFSAIGQFWSQVGVHVSQSVDLRGYAICGVENRPNFANSAPTLADLLGNGTVQVVVVGNVYNCGTNPYTDLYEMPFIFNGDRSRWAAGGYDWIVIPTPDTAAAPLSEDYNLIENSVPNPVTADLDGDGKKEILYASYDGRVHAYWLDKTEHGNWPFEVSNFAGEGFYRFASEPVVADLNGDGKAEVIFASWTQHGSNQAGKLYIVSWDGNLIDSFDLPRDPSSDYGGSLAAPTLAHLDGDPNLDVVIGTVDMGVVAYRLAGTAGAQLLWPTGRGNLGRTGASLSGSLNNSYKSVTPPRPSPGSTLSYTLSLVNPGPLLPSARMTDTLPINATLLTGTVTATSGSLGISPGVITWQGAVSATAPITITYAMTVSSGISQPTAIINTALLDDGLGHVQPRTATAVVNGLATWLPAIWR